MTSNEELESFFWGGGCTNNHSEDSIKVESRRAQVLQNTKQESPPPKDIFYSEKGSSPLQDFMLRIRSSNSRNGSFHYTNM
jgi:hypothetical protein